MFATLLWPHQASEIQAVRRTVRTPDRALRLIDNRDPDVRAAMCELLGLRRQTDVTDRIESLAENDNAPEVRAACKEALVRLQEGTGTKAGDTILPTGEP